MGTVSVCAQCDDTGWKRVGEGPDARVVRCDCRQQGRAERLLSQARIPRRYDHCELSTFEVPFDPSARSINDARLFACRYVEEFPPLPSQKKGIVFVGSVGTGKTHLAVGIIKELIGQKGIPCLFCDYRELLKEIQNSYNPAVATTEMELLRPVFETDVLVLDELGAVKPTQWVWDTVSYILNSRYNNDRSTIITTNFSEAPEHQWDSVETDRLKAEKATAKDSLGDRIGNPMYSRLHEMCRFVRVDGPDYRLKASPRP